MFTGLALSLPRITRTRLRLPGLFIVGALGIVAFGALSALVTDQVGANFGYYAKVIRGVVLLPMFLAFWRPGRRETIAVALAYMVGSAINLIASLINGPAAAGRYEGLSTHPNVMAYGQALSLALVPFLIATMPRKFHWFVGVLAAASAYGIWISGSRAALVCAVALTLLYPVFTRSVRAGLGITVLVCPAIVAISSAWHDPGSSALSRLLGSPSGQASDAVRKQGAQAGIDQFLGHPLLGDGWLTVWGAHNAYLQVAAAIGIFGLASYFLLLSSVLRPIVAVPRPYGLLALPAVAAVVLDMVLPVVGSKVVWCVIGLALCAESLAQRHPPAQSASSADMATIPPQLVPSATNDRRSGTQYQREQR